MKSWHQQAKRAPAIERTVDGIVFDSKGEARRWAELKLLQAAGLIWGLSRQVVYPLFINDEPVKIRSKGYPNGRTVSYRADFVYFENDNQQVVEDYKGFDDPCSRLRRAVVEAIYGFEIRITR
jgi:hypothetical protein